MKSYASRHIEQNIKYYTAIKVKIIFQLIDGGVMVIIVW